MSKTFRGGVYPDHHKDYTKDVPLREYLPTGDLVIPLNQHIGKPAKAIVKKGQKVLAGELIAEADGFMSSNVASSVSGTVKAVEERLTVAGTMSPCIVIQNDGEYTPAEGVGEETDYTVLTNEEILEKIRAAGVIGMGGAGFPAHVKLAPKDPSAIKYCIANGSECEPYITCDDQLMRTNADEIVAGLKIMLRLFPNAEGVIAIEDNKPEAAAAMKKAIEGESNIRVEMLQAKYPEGGERSIMSVIAGKHIKLGMLPADVGCIVSNVGTIWAIYRAVCYNEPSMLRTITVTGDAVAEPANFIVKVGTSFAEVLEAAGGLKEGAEVQKFICGGPMMGLAMSSLDVPICKNNNALVALTTDPVAIAQEQQTACIRCGRCNQVCPLGLTPQMMAAAAQRKDYDRYENKLYGLECIACGACAYICPAKRPLMQLFKQTKAEITAAKKN